MKMVYYEQHNKATQVCISWSMMENQSYDQSIPQHKGVVFEIITNMKKLPYDSGFLKHNI